MTNKSNHKPLVAPPSNTPDQTYRGLRNFNLGMGFLHLVQGILMIVISNDTTYPIYTIFLSFDLDARTLKPDPKLCYELPFGPAVLSSCCSRPWPISTWPPSATSAT